MLSAELLGAFMHVVTAAARGPNSYKKRRNGETRMFGGINFVMLTDFWQLHPVTDTFLAASPSDIPAGRVQNPLKLFWGGGLDSIRSFWPLTEVMRCADPWYNAFLRECRDGTLTKDMYAYFLGYPTLFSPKDTCSCNGDVDIDPLLGGVRQDWKKAFLAGCNDMMELINNSECTKCKEERVRRQRVLGENGLSSTSAKVREARFCEALAFYSFNVPRYFTLQLRAREFAKQNNVQLTWCYARDVPLHPEDRELPPDALQTKLTAWLNRHDQETSHISSILPLAVGMPIRLTENVDRDRQMYRGRRGSIYGWTLRADCIPEEMGGEWLLPSLPLVIYLFMEGATWQIGKVPVGVYPMR